MNKYKYFYIIFLRTADIILRLTKKTLLKCIKNNLKIYFLISFNFSLDLTYLYVMKKIARLSQIKLI